MEQTNLPQSKNGVERTADGLKTPQPPRRIININSDCKQMSGTNPNEPKRVIKQIVSLDSKKLKALGIESNILSALTKFNGNEKSFMPAKQPVSVNSEPSSSSAASSSSSTNNASTKSSVQQPSMHLAAISPVKPIISISATTSQTKLPDTPSTKKIQVLSNVLLSDNKLNLKDITAIASSTPVNSTNVPYVPVLKPSQIKTVQRVESDPVVIDKDVAETIKLNTDQLDEPNQLNKTCLTESESKSSETNALKGFSTSDLKSSQHQFEHLRNEFHTKPTTSESPSKECETNTISTSQTSPAKTKSPAKVETQFKIEVDDEIEIGPEQFTETNFPSNFSNTNTSSDTGSSSESTSGGSESDLDDLIKEAQMTIESELLTDKGSTPVVTKRPRLVEKELLDLLAEHVDKDRLIDDFLDSTINSFRTRCDTPDSDSDSSVEIEKSRQVEESDSDSSVDNMQFLDAHSNEDAVEINHPDELNVVEVDNPTNVECVTHQSDPIEENLPSPKSRKRRIENSDSNSKRKKSESTNKTVDELDVTTVQTMELPTNILGDTKDDQPTCDQPTCDQPPSLECTQKPLTSSETPKQPTATKRGRKPKQTMLSEYFSVQNSNTSETKVSLDKSSNVTTDAPVKSSRYGRVIKPKSLDIESTPSIRSERKSSKETMESTILVQTHTISEAIPPTTAIMTVVKPLKKRGRHKPPTNTTEIDNIPSSESINHPEDDININITSSVDTSQCPDTSLTFKVLAARRKSTEKLLSEIIASTIDTGDPNYEYITYDQVDQHAIISKEVTPKRRGRPSKKTTIHSSTIDDFSKTDTHMISDIKSENSTDESALMTLTQPHSMVDESPSILVATTSKREVTKRRGRPSKNAAIETAIETTNVNKTVESDRRSSRIFVRSDKDLLAPKQLRSKELGGEHQSQSFQSPATECLETSIEQTESHTEPQVQSEMNESCVVKKRGRPRVKPIQSKQRTDPEPVPDESKFTCGNCQEEIAQSKWKAHESIHFGVTYRVGIDEAIDVDDSGTQNRIMIRYMKHHKIQYLKCPKCGIKKKSALGYISHVEVCGLTSEEAKSLRAECEYCKKSYRKVSLASHQQSFCTVRRLEMEQQKADEMTKTVCETVPEAQCEEVVYSESGRPKRIIKKAKPISKAADEFIKVGMKITGGTFKNWTNQLREENIIKCLNDNCPFTSTDVGEMRVHFKQCRESIHQCKICQKIERSRDDIVQHIETLHPNELKAQESDDNADNSDDADFKAGNQSSSSDGEYDDDDLVDEQVSNKKLKPSKRKRTIPLKRVMEEESPLLWEMVSTFYTRIINTRSGYYRKTYQWTKEFIEQNYDLNVLALNGHLRDDFEHVRLPQRELNKFLGLLNFKSPSFSCHNEVEYKIEKSMVVDDDQSLRLNLFENIKSEHTARANSSVLFCGGRIVTAEWVPFPNNYTGNQVLAICAHSKGTKPISLTNWLPPEKCKNLIQLWSISTQNNNTNINETEFMYGIAYEDGPICTMSFCPSDAYVASKRLAIVAVPDTTGNINILSLPDNISKGKSNVPTVIKVKPDIRLQLGFKQDENPSQTVTQLAWSRTKGHKILCAGYNTGLIAIWHFDHMNVSYMCRKEKLDGIPVLIPQHTFMGALSFVTQLDLHPNDDGSIRWILVGGLDRRIRLYDLLDPQLTPFTSQIFNSRIISGTWPMHWPIYLTIIDAALTRKNGGLHIKSVLYTDNQPRSTNLFNDCEPSNLAFSDWLNTGIFGNDAGDLFMINFQQLLLHDRFDDSSDQKILSCTEVFLDEEPIISEECESNERIKVLFKDFEDQALGAKANTRISPVDQYPYARITRVTINPNESHQKMYAIGYELGFCRIHFMP